MTQEALKLVMDALDDLLYWDNGKPEYDEARKALQVGKQALAQPEQEPVAWMDADGNVSDNNDHKCFPIPLYTTPPQRTEQEPFEDLATELFVVAQTSPADDGFSDTIERIESWLREHFSTPPQRTWVGLTDDEIDRVTDAQWGKGVNKPIYAAHRAYARAIEQALKEKNI